jgi:putative Holliday junction resolvase
MITSDVQEFCLKLHAITPILAIDFGQKKLGIAVTNSGRSMALPVAILPCSLHHLDPIINQYKPCGIVIGLPVNMDGSMGSQVELTHKFALNILKRFNLPILLQDERLTSRAASNALKTLGLNRKQRDARDDQVAACMILETVLQKIGNLCI